MQTMGTHCDLSGRYEIRLVEAGTWELRQGGKRHSLHLESFAQDSDGFAGAKVSGPPAFRIETAEPAEELPGASQISVLSGEHNGTCYTLRWEQPGWPVTGVLDAGLTCLPTSKAGVSSSYAAGASSTQAGVVYWNPLLPADRIQVRWFFPVVLMFCGIGIWSAVGMTLAYLTRRSGVSASLGWETETP